MSQQMAPEVSKALLQEYAKHTKTKIAAPAVAASACGCDICFGTGRISIPLIGWTYCGCAKQAAPFNWANHDH